MEIWKSWLALIGRIAVSSYVLRGGVNHTMDWSRYIKTMVGKSYVMPEAFLTVGSTFMIVGALLVMVGYFSRIGALLQIAFLLLAAATIHNFWTVTGDASNAQLFMFLRNISFAGALLYIVSCGPGSISIDARRSK